MLRFLVSLTLVFMLPIGFCWYWVVEHPMGFSDPEYVNFKYKGDVLDRCELTPLVIIGDSTSVASMAPNLIGSGTLNLGLGGSRAQEILAISKRILACKNLPKAVILSVVPTGFAYDPNCCFWDRAVKFGFLDITFHDLEELRQHARSYDDTLIFGPFTLFDAEARLKSFLYTIRFPPYYYGALLNSGFNGRLKDNDRRYVITSNQKGQFNFVTHPGNWDSRFGDLESFPYPLPLQLDVVDEIMDLYQRHNVPLYYVGPPYKQNDVFKPGLRTGFKEFLASYEKHYSTFHVLGDLFFKLPNEDFGDETHVNVDGMAAFSTYLAHKLDDQHIEH